MIPIFGELSVHQRREFFVNVFMVHRQLESFFRLGFLFFARMIVNLIMPQNRVHLKLFSQVLLYRLNSQKPLDFEKSFFRFSL